MDVRFKITFSDSSYRPWALWEWQTPPRGVFGFRGRGGWRNIATEDTKEAAEKRMQAMVDGERAIEPTYYDETGRAASSW